jgi:hypothetical protein
MTMRSKAKSQKRIWAIPRKPRRFRESQSRGDQRDDEKIRASATRRTSLIDSVRRR